MPQVINTNVMSLNAQRNLNKSQGALQTSLQRLSSGMRINSAKDDAAGLSISNRMTAQINGMNQAGRNANDGISLAQTGEAAMGEIGNALQRMRELAVQSRNATNSESDRQSLDAEFQQLSAEIDRLATTTAFNGRKILDGTFGTAAFQVGANVGETISVDVSTSMRTNSIGLYASRDITMQDTLNSAVADTLLMDASGDLIINGTNVDAAVAGTYGRGQNSAYAVANAINLGTDTHGVTAVANSLSKTFTAASLSNFAFTDADADSAMTYTLSINGQQIFTQAQGAPTPKNASELATLINGFNSTTGVTAAAQSNGDLVLTAADGRNIEITEAIGGTVTDVGTDVIVGYFGNTLNTASGTYVADFYKSTISLSSAASMTIDVGAAAADFLSDADLDPADAAITVEASGIVSRNILTTSASDLAINSIDQAIKDVDSFRSTFGAMQSRFESAISSLQASSEALSAARSRILDTDFAAETANLTKSQILQQAGTAMLAQSNQMPQNVLSLLG